jgi:Putative MetA-pathway of phenol degradation
MPSASSSLVSSAADSEWQGQVDIGFTYAFNKNTQFDLGCNFGVTKSAPDFNPFVGFSFRF